MFNFDLDDISKLGKLANAAKERQQDTTPSDVGGLAQSVIQGLQNTDKLGGLAEKATEQAVPLLKSLLEQAQKVLKTSPVNKVALDACIKKGVALLAKKDGKDIDANVVTKLTAELSELMQKASPADAGTSTAQDAAAGSLRSIAGNVANDIVGAVAHAAAGSVADDVVGAVARAAAGSVAGSTAADATDTKATTQAKASALHTEPPVDFTDVDKSAYYYDAVQWAVKNGIASGTTATTFGPDDACTRAQTVTLIWRASGSPAPRSQDSPFTDVKKGAYYYEAVLWAVEKGITSGATETAFHPDATVTRAQVATFLYRNAGSPAVNVTDTFQDVPADAYYAKPVAWVAAKGVTSGTAANTFSPDKVCTRGQIVAFLYRAR